MDAVPVSDDRITAEEAFRILGFRSQQQFNHARRRLERVLDRSTGVHTQVPQFEAQLSHLPAAEVGRRKRQFLDANILVVPEWGGIKWPSASWTYSRLRCQRTREQASPIVG